MKRRSKQCTELCEALLSVKPVPYFPSSSRLPYVCARERRTKNQRTEREWKNEESASQTSQSRTQVSDQWNVEASSLSSDSLTDWWVVWSKHAPGYFEEEEHVKHLLACLSVPVSSSHRFDEMSLRSISSPLFLSLCVFSLLNLVV